jgi:hypothetical protein
MLKFAVFDNAGLAKAWSLAHAHVVGQEQLVLPGEITFDNGYIVVEKKTDGGAGSAGLGLLYPVDGVGGVDGGTFVLRTCLLPQRGEPYLLSLELARQKIMTLLNKLEEWALFDRSADEPAIQMVERARDMFTVALLAARRSGSAAGRGGIPPYSLAAEQAARAALAHAVAAGEALAMLQARVQHDRRCTGELALLAKISVPDNALTDDEARDARGAIVGSPGVVLPEMPKLGVRVNPNAFGPAICDVIAQSFDFVSVPMRWIDLEPTEGKYAFAKFDKWIEWAVTQAKIPVHAGAVIDLHPRAVPGWLSIWEHDYETLRDVIFEHVKNVVTRYRRTVNTWTVTSGLNVGGTFKLTYEQAVDLTRSCTMIVKKLQPTAKIHVEIAQPFGEHAGLPRGSKSIPPVLYAELMNQTQTYADAFAVRVQMGQGEVGRGTRPIVSLSAALDRIAGADRPLAISVVGCPSRPASEDPQSEQGFDPGTWRSGWTPEAQAEYGLRVAAVLAAKPYVQSVCWQEVIDAPPGSTGTMIGGGLLTAQGQPKPILRALAELRAALRDRKPMPPI